MRQNLPPAPLANRKGRRSRQLVAWAGAVVLVGIYLSIGCPLRFFTGVCCPGCGMTRAVLALLRLDFSGALREHPLVVLLPFAAAWLVLRCLGRRMPKKQEQFCTVCVAAAFLAVYFIRLFLGDPLVKPDFSSSVFHKIFLLWRGLS